MLGTSILVQDFYFKGRDLMEKSVKKRRVAKITLIVLAEIGRAHV